MDKDEAIKNMRRSLELLESSVYSLRRAIEALENGSVNKGASQEDLTLVGQIKDIVSKGRKQ